VSGPAQPARTHPITEDKPLAAIVRVKLIHWIGLTRTSRNQKGLACHFVKECVKLSVSFSPQETPLWLLLQPDTHSGQNHGQLQREEDTPKSMRTVAPTIGHPDHGTPSYLLLRMDTDENRFLSSKHDLVGILYFTSASTFSNFLAQKTTISLVRYLRY
jgi:hypothetical protein